jgi:hypothetical protein
MVLRRPLSDSENNFDKCGLIGTQKKSVVLSISWSDSENNFDREK